MIEIDQDGKAIALNGRSEHLPYVVEIINTYPARLVREDFVDAILSKLPDFAKNNEKYATELLAHAEDLSAQSEKAYCEAVCGENSQPMFDYQIDVHQYE
jgi:hypothetical protein